MQDAGTGCFAGRGVGVVEWLVGGDRTRVLRFRGPRGPSTRFALHLQGGHAGACCTACGCCCLTLCRACWSVQPSWRLRTQRRASWTGGSPWPHRHRPQHATWTDSPPGKSGFWRARKSACTMASTRGGRSIAQNESGKHWIMTPFTPLGRRQHRVCDAGEHACPRTSPPYGTARHARHRAATGLFFFCDRRCAR